MIDAHFDADLTERATFSVVIDEVKYTVPRRCPHRGGYLEYGVISAQRKTITCPLHFSVFCLQTGAQLHGPPCGSLGVHRDLLHDGS